MRETRCFFHGFRNWYDLRDDGTNPKDIEHNFGSLTYDFYPKPVYVTYNMLAAQLGEAEFLRKADLGSTMEGYVFRSKRNETLLGMWSNDASEELHLFSGVKEACSIIDLFGNERPIPLANGTAAFKIGRIPAILKSSGGVEGGRLFRTGGAFNVPSGEERPLTLEFSNPTEKTIRFRYRCTLPEGLSGEKLSGTVTLAPQKQQNVELLIRAEKSFHSLPGTPKKITFEISAGSWTETIASEVHSVVMLPEGTFANKPDFVLADKELLTRLVPSAPTHEHLYWKGPTDLSANVFLAKRGETLLLKLEVTDDIQHQPYHERETWMGDNVQIAMQLPGQRGLWEIGLARLADGSAESFVWLAPAGFDAPRTAQAIRLKTERDEQRKLTTYEAEIPFPAIGMTEATGRSGFRFNLLINDNDGEMRESYLAIAPGIGDTKSPHRYPTVCFR